MQTAFFTKTFDDRPLKNAIATTAELGFDGVEIMAREPHFSADVDLERVKAIRELLDDHDLRDALSGGLHRRSSVFS